MVTITLAQGYSLYTMLAVAAAAIALAGVFYYHTYGTLSGAKWRLLLALRAAAILLVVLLLFRPVLSYTESVARKSALIFLLDASQSMSISDDASGITRFSQARTQIEKWWNRLQKDFELHLFSFADKATPHKGPEDLVALAPDGQATSLSSALQAAARQETAGPVEAVFLLSDGIHNSARSPIEAASRMNMVCHTVGVGASLRGNPSFRDVQVTGIDCPDRLMLNNLARIKGSIEGVNLAGRVVKAILEEDGQQIGEQELTLDDVEGAQEVAFEFRPGAKGQHRYTVRVAPLPDEKIAENNQRSTVALVVEPGLRVLYIEGTLRAEYGAIVDRFLAKDPDLEFCALVQTRPNVFLKRTNIEGLQFSAIPNDAATISKFDVFVLGDLDASYLKPAVQELILSRVREGGGLLMLGGYHSLGPGGYEGTLIGDALPVRLGGRDIGQNTDAFLPTLTPDGARHPVFANIGDFFPTRQRLEPRRAGLPPLNGCTRIEAAKPGATVLATQGPAEDAPPVLAWQPLGKGRTAVFCGDTTRNWQQGARAFGEESPFTRFWGQMVRALAGRDASVEAAAGITGSADKARYEPEEPIRLSAVVRNQEGQGAAGAHTVAKITLSSGETIEIPLLPQAGPPGHYGGEYDPKAPGLCEIVFEARVGEQTVTSGKLAVEVGRQNLEFEKLDLDEKTLGRIAAETGGRYANIAASDLLIDQLDRALKKKQRRVDRELYWPPLVWTLFVSIVSAEWFLRRKFQLR